jgi:hypothetical protein
VFDGYDLLINSGTTKIFSLASKTQNLIIYDGRVGAALGHLVVLAMKKLGLNEVSPSLLFAWGDKKGGEKSDVRNPSTIQVRFPRLHGKGSRKSNNILHAKNMNMASRVLSDAATAIGHDVTVRELEAALFMWGYAVN